MFNFGGELVVVVIAADDFVKRLVYFFEYTFASWALYSLEVFINHLITTLILDVCKEDSVM